MNRWGAEVAASWHESTKLILDQRDKAVASLKERMETQAELAKQNEEFAIRMQALENENHMLSSQIASLEWLA